MKISNQLKRMIPLLGIVVIGFVLTNMWGHNGVNSAPGTETQKIENIAPQWAYDLIQEHKNDENIVILDVRTPKEFAHEHIENAINSDYYSETFKDDLNSLDKNKTYLIYCRSGGRSKMALDIVKELGFREAYNMLGGITQWKAKGVPTTE